MIDAIRAAALGDIPHGFLGRSGGVSDGVLAGLNCGLGSGDDRVAIAENRRRVIAAVRPGATLQTLYQVHSAEVVTLAEPIGDRARPHADAMVTDRPGLLLGILTADCAPVLLADAQAGVIGAAHAACFAMAMSNELGQAGLTATSIEAQSTVTLDPAKGAITQVHVDVEVNGKV